MISAVDCTLVKICFQNHFLCCILRQCPQKWNNQTVCGVHYINFAMVHGDILQKRHKTIWQDCRRSRQWFMTQPTYHHQRLYRMEVWDGSSVVQILQNLLLANYLHGIFCSDVNVCMNAKYLLCFWGKKQWHDTFRKSCNTQSLQPFSESVYFTKKLKLHKYKSA